MGSDQSSMLASGAVVGDYFFRSDQKRFWRCVAVPSNVISAWRVSGLPQGTSVYVDPLTSKWMIARHAAMFTPFAKTIDEFLGNVSPPPPPGSAVTGTATVDFGSFPGSSEASVNVTGQTGILSSSVVMASVRSEATDDHSAEEHLVETIGVRVGPITPGVGFTIFAFNTNPITEPADPRTGRGGQGTLLTGLFNVQWTWS